MGEPSAVCKSLGGTAGRKDSCTLSPQDEYANLRDWEYLLNFRPRAVKDQIRTRFGNDPGYHPIEGGWGPLNLDFYPVQILKLPSIAGTELSAEALVSFVRNNINDFVDTSNSKFMPYDTAVDGPIWRSSNPLGAVVSIGVNVYLDPSAAKPAANKGASVVVAESTPAYWIFSTLPTDQDWHHPVSGNRQFGCATLRIGDSLSDVYIKAGVTLNNTDGDALYFFTRAADRLTTLAEYAGSSMAFAGAHALWLSLQQKIAAWIIKNGGQAVVAGCVSERWDWDAIRRGGVGGLWHDPSQ